MTELAERLRVWRSVTPLNQRVTMTGGVNIFCFTASYAVALALEVAGLWLGGAWRRVLVGVAVVAGTVAHTLYLARRAAEVPGAPLSSPYDWYLVAAWVLSIISLAAAAYYPRRSLGLFLLPATLGLIGASLGASRTPLAEFSAARWGGLAHGLLLALGTVAVLVGFLAGLMYLLQSHRLKKKLPAREGFRLPSLEWLERVNNLSLAMASLCVALGFFSGVFLYAVRGGVSAIPWRDPVVLSLTAMLVWLATAEGFRLIYPAARRGRKVAYLTLTAFVFLVLTLVMFAREDAFHGKERVQDSGVRSQESETSSQSERSQPSQLRAGSSPCPAALCMTEARRGRDNPVRSWRTEDLSLTPSSAGGVA